MSARGKWTDRRILLVFGGTIVLALIGVSILARTADDSDTRPSVDNSGSAGARAAFLMMQRLGHAVGRWDKPLAQLDSVPAERTTLVIAEPHIGVMGRKEEAADLKRFLDRGGRVLLTGTWAQLLPGGEAGPAPTFKPAACFTAPEGPGELARSGSVQMPEAARWTATGPQFRVEHRCGKDAVVVRVPEGKGEAVWWASPGPLSNVGLKNDNNLKLLLASLYGNGGQGRTVLFDEYLQEAHANDAASLEHLPVVWLAVQFAAVFLLLLFSFSRRRGPLRMPVEVPRTSPVEFAQSMGDLYEKAGATDAATEAARRRLLRTLQRDAGVARGTVEEGPQAIAETLNTRLGGNWEKLAQHLSEAQNAVHESVRSRSALALVRALGEDERRVREALRPAAAVKIVEGDLAETVKE